MVELKEPEISLILQEIKDHASYWHSDIAKRITVEKHLTEKGMKGTTEKIDMLVKADRLIVIKRPKGDYLKLEKDPCGNCAQGIDACRTCRQNRKEEP